MDQNVPQQPAASGGGGKKVAWIIIAILVILGLVWYFMSKKTNGGYSQTKSANDTAAQVQPSSNSNQPMSLKDLLAGGSQKCDVSFQNQNSQTQGTLFVGGGKFRGDFSATVNGKTVMSHMINDGQTDYTWMEGSATGFKMSVSAMNNPPQGQTNQNSQTTVDPNAKYDYHCSPIALDNSEFAPPPSVTFSEMSAMMAQPTPAPSPSGGSLPTPAPSSASMKAQECAACNNAGASKAQCLAALQCN